MLTHLSQRFPKIWHCYIRGPKGSHTYQLIWKKYASRTWFCPTFSLSDPMRGDFCRFLQTLAATGCGHVFLVLSAVTHWVAEITSCPLATSGQCIINSSAPYKSSLHKLDKEVYQTRKWKNHVQQSAVKQRHGSGESFNRFPSSKVRRKQWLASMKLLNPPVLKHAVVYTIW